MEYVVVVPDVDTGTVMGHLNRIGAEIKSVALAGEVYTLTVDLDEATAGEFQQWLRAKTNGKGRVSPAARR
jgi:hypothetical protein